MSRRIIGPALLVLILAISIFKTYTPAEKPAGAIVEAKLPSTFGADVLCQVASELGRNESFYDLLLREGLSPKVALEAGAALSHVLPPGQLQAHDMFSFLYSADSALAMIRVERSPLEQYELKADGEGFTARPVEVRVDTVHQTVRGRLSDNLWTSFVSAGAAPSIIVAYTEVFAWSVDFFREARPGDGFSVRYPEYYVGSELVGTGDVEAAYYLRGTDTLWAFRFANDGSYYDYEGRSLKKALLRAPLKFSRISSGFSRHRLHPVSQVVRPHLAVDYAAASGTPVYAAGDGQVSYAGWKNGLGKCVEIRHPNGYRTVYGHLSRIAPDLAQGTRVSQRDRIGAVGQTGNATGPHLHYEVWQGGAPVDPRTLKLPAAGPVSGDLRAAFVAMRDQVVPELLPVYGPVLASAR